MTWKMLQAVRPEVVMLKALHTPPTSVSIVVADRQLRDRVELCFAVAQGHEEQVLETWAGPSVFLSIHCPY